MILTSSHSGLQHIFLASFLRLMTLAYLGHFHFSSVFEKEYLDFNEKKKCHLFDNDKLSLGITAFHFTTHLSESFGLCFPSVCFFSKELLATESTDFYDTEHLGLQYTIHIKFTENLAHCYNTDNFFSYLASVCPGNVVHKNFLLKKLLYSCREICTLKG